MPALLIAASNIHVRGDGPGVSVLFYSINSTVFRSLLFDGTNASGGTVSHVSAKDLTVYGIPNATSPGAYGGYNGQGCMLNYRACVGFLADNVEVHDSPNCGIVAIGSTVDTFRGCESQHNYADGLHALGGCARVTMTHNHIHDTGDDGIGIACDVVGTTATISEIIVAHNTITRGGSRGICIMSPSTDVLVDGNTITDVAGSGIQVDSAGYGIYGGLTTDTVTVARNIIRRANSYSSSYGNRPGSYNIIVVLANVGGTLVDVALIGNLIDG